MFGQSLARARQPLPDPLAQRRTGLLGHRSPAALDLIESLRVQRVVRALAVALDGLRGDGDLGKQLLLLAGLLELGVALGAQNLVDVLVIATAHLADELSQQLWIVDGLRRCLTNPGRCPGDHHPGHRLNISRVEGGLQGFLLGGGGQRATFGARFRDDLIGGCRRGRWGGNS